MSRRTLETLWEASEHGTLPVVCDASSCTEGLVTMRELAANSPRYAGLRFVDAVQFVAERITVDKSGTSPVDGLMLGILAAFAEFERRRIKERQAEGIALAKARGKYVQAPKLSDTDVEQARVMIQMGIPKAEVARTFGVSRQTLYTSLRRQASD